jgi:hypothetical protein
MRTTILSIILFSDIFFAGICDGETILTNEIIGAAGTKMNAGTNGYPVIPAIQDVVDSWVKGAKANGLACAISFAPDSNNGTPLGYVYVINTTTNYMLGYLRLPIEAVSQITLYNSQGEQIKKTAIGEHFEYWTQSQIKNWFDEMNRVRWNRRGFRIDGMFFQQLSGGINFLQSFQIKQPGEYTLHLAARLVKSEQDKSGQFLTTSLPEVVAKVQIQPKDIAPTNSVQNDQTNSPAH